jgi:hypothetical protein
LRFRGRLHPGYPDGGQMLSNYSNPTWRIYDIIFSKMPPREMSIAFLQSN